VSSLAAVRRLAPEGNQRRVLVATMGGLHQGHLELVRLAREAADGAKVEDRMWKIEDRTSNIQHRRSSAERGNGEVAVSIFVNPLQFEPGADYERYPRPEKADEDLCRAAGVDLLFRPAPDEMYRADCSVTVEEHMLSQTLCGGSRPGHFRGVCTVVAKLFHLLEPDAAVFGEKDFQQLAIIRRMVRDLDFPIEIIAVPTVREPDGVACSSRNQYLSGEERRQAPMLRSALLQAAERVRDGETSAEKLIGEVQQQISTAPAARIDYVEVVETESLQRRDTVGGGSLLAVAVFFGKTRLIDNIVLA